MPGTVAHPVRRRGRGVPGPGDYRFDLKKEYNFDTDKPPIDVWGIPADVKMLALAPSQGYARDFTVQGSTNGHIDSTTG
ncbi:hypothetical protein [Kitasatospora xanthocidica]|uniref:hypothetical protein n=1 Tax=Kitasatospora xanthocidica TaxID=83382 RepID=UPI0016780251|nr:hypothetical protein [Kitasatospora xanthocidica]